MRSKIVFVAELIMGLAISFIVVAYLAGCGNMAPAPMCPEETKYDSVTGNCMPTMDEGEKTDGGQMTADLTPNAELTMSNPDYKSTGPIPQASCDLSPDLVGQWNCEGIICNFKTKVQVGICTVFCYAGTEEKFDCPMEPLDQNGNYTCSVRRNGGIHRLTCTR